MKVSVLIPTYNYAEYIGKALMSILSQDYDQSLIEVIVIDDGSTDNTEEVVSQYKARFQVLKYFKTTNQGKAAATYLGFQYANGDVIFNLDADDFFLTSKVAKVVNIFNTYPLVTHVAHPALIAIDGVHAENKEELPALIIDRELAGDYLLRHFLSNNLLFGGGSTFAVRKIFNFLPNDTHLCDMYIDEFLVYRSLVFGNSFFLSEPLSCWNIHSNNYSISNKNGSLKAERIAKSAKGLLALLNKENFIYKDIYRIKYFCILSHKAQQEKHYGNWVFSNIKLLFLISMLFLKHPLLSVRIFYSYNILKRFLPPFIYTNFKKIR